MPDPPIPADGRCAAMVWHGWHQYPCSRKAAETVQSKGYCKQHARKLRERIAWERRYADAD